MTTSKASHPPDYAESFFSSNLLSSKFNSFFAEYSRLLGPFIGSEICVIEVGVAHGGSVESLARYLGPKATIIGVDISIPEIDSQYWERLHAEEGAGQVILRQADATDEDFWAKLSAEFGQPDIVIDDGGHTNLQQISVMDWALRNAKHLAICEDITCSYMFDFGNPHPYSFMNYVAHIVKLMNLTRIQVTSNTTQDSVARISRIELLTNLVVFHLGDAKVQRSNVVTNKNGMSNVQELILPSLHSRFLSKQVVHSAVRALNRPGWGSLLVLSRTLLGVLRFFGNFRSRRFFG